MKQLFMHAGNTDEWWLSEHKVKNNWHACRVQGGKKAANQDERLLQTGEGCTGIDTLDFLFLYRLSPNDYLFTDEMHFVHVGKHRCCLVTKLCPAACGPMGYSLPGSSVHGISQARILEWVAISFSRGSSQTRDQTWFFCLAGEFFSAEPLEMLVIITVF